jgi:hypothetical protein
MNESNYERSDVNRLLAAMRHQEPDRIPHLEFWVTSQTVFEYVLEKPLDYAIVDAALGGQSISHYAEAVMKKTPVVAASVAALATGLYWLTKRRDLNLSEAQVTLPQEDRHDH